MHPKAYWASHEKRGKLTQKASFRAKPLALVHEAGQSLPQGLLRPLP
jgi:hypothetical protein